MSKAKTGIIFTTASLLGLGLASTSLIAIGITPKKKDGTNVTTYVVTCIARGETISTQKVIKGEKAVKPELPWEEYVAEDWYKDQSFTQTFDFATPITANTTIYAKTVAIPQFKAVTFNAGNNGHFDGAAKEATSYIQKGKTLGEVSRHNLIIDDKYVFSGWTDKDKKPVLDTTEIHDNITLYASYEKLSTKVSIILNAKVAGGELPGNNIFVYDNETTWGSIKADMPAPTKAGNNFIRWYIDNPLSDIPDSTVFEKNTTLYPLFEPVAQPKTKTLKVMLNERQSIDGSATIEIASFDPVKFCDINKPTVHETGYSFAGWYKDEGHQEPWDPNDEITQESEEYICLYPNFIEQIKNPVVKFAYDESSLNDEHVITWQGNQTIILDAAQDTLWSNVSKPIVYCDYDETKEDYSDYYLDHWYTKDSNGKEIDIPAKITKSITVYPCFKLKPEFNIVTKVDPTSPVVEKHVFNPIKKWGEVIKPEASKVEDQWFVCWEGTLKGDEDPIELPNNINISAIDPNKNITPVYSDQVNLIEFSSVGWDKTLNKTIDIDWIKGNPEVGVYKYKDNWFKDINKPVPGVDPSKHEGKEYDFVDWQIEVIDEETGDKKWEYVTNSTIIEATEEEIQTTTNIRPVMQQKVTLTFDPNGGEIKTEDPSEITVSAAAEFSTIRRPSVYKDGCQFLYWAIKNEQEEFVKVNSSTKFSSDTYLYAIYVDDIVSYTVNFHLKDSDLATKEEFAVEIYGAQYTINQKAEEEAPEFKNIPKATATKYLHTFVGWEIITGKDESGQPIYGPVPEGSLTAGGDGLDVYANFEATGNYKLITVAEPTEECPYEIVDPSKNKIFAKVGDLFPLKSNNEIDIQVRRKGYKVSGWKTSSGKQIKKETISELDNFENIVPQFEEQKFQVTFDKENDPEVTLETKVITVDAYSKIIDDGILDNAPTASKPRCKTIGWKIKESEGEYEEITNSTLVTHDIKLVPVFRGDSEFKYSDKAYFFDSSAGSAGRWAAILNYGNENDEITIYYADSAEGEIAYKDKTTFNEEIFFGTQVTSLPINFMRDCIAWNNGAAKGDTSKPLTLPKNLSSVGDNAFLGCISFNQKLDFTQSAQELTVGYNFMKNCYSFNSDVDFTSTSGLTNTITLKSGFMFNCRSFSKKLILKNRDIDAATADDDYILSTTSKYCPMYTQTFTVVLTNSVAATKFTNRFGILGDETSPSTSGVWRKYVTDPLPQPPKI